jgi:LmbE family N-acetylglucosaminyl deacetylase
VKRRFIVYGTLIFILVGAYKFQPIEIDFIPRKVPRLAPSDIDSNHLFSSKARVMVIVGHPDDSEFYIAGTLLKLKAAGAEIRQLLHTDGDKAYYFWADHRDLRATRRREQQEASARWGAKELQFLAYPDGRLRANDEVIKRTADVIREWKPDYILAFDGDYPPRASHQDHRRSGDTVLPACRAAGFHGWVLHFSTQAPNYAVDVSDVWSERLELVGIHKSQFAGEKLKRILAFIADGAVEQGEPKGFTFGEAFRAEQFDGGFQINDREVAR